MSGSQPTLTRLRVERLEKSTTGGQMSHTWSKRSLKTLKEGHRKHKRYVRHKPQRSLVLVSSLFLLDSDDDFSDCRVWTSSSGFLVPFDFNVTFNRELILMPESCVSVLSLVLFIHCQIRCMKFVCGWWKARIRSMGCEPASPCNSTPSSAVMLL